MAKFQKGHKPKGHRRKGTPNRQTTLLKDAIIMAAEAVGNRRKQGRDGLVGYLTWLATAEPKAFAALLGRTLPLQVTGVNNGPLQMVTITMTAKEAQSAYQATLKSREPLLLPGP